jgi:hypothetical protein
MEPKIHEQLLSYLSNLPRNMLSFYHTGNIVEFVLHELCDESCFNLDKAAYFIDNPDFDCLKGIAGFSLDERYTDHATIWDNPDRFASHMQKCLFNQEVRRIEQTSLKRSTLSEEQILKALAQKLDLDSTTSKYYIWPIKHGNYGVLIFQRTRESNGIDEYMPSAFHLLGFCPF